MKPPSVLEEYNEAGKALGGFSRETRPCDHWLFLTSPLHLLHQSRCICLS